MDFGIVHYGSTAYFIPAKTGFPCKLVTELPDSQTNTLWKESLQKLGFDTTLEEPAPKDLFLFVKTAFEEQKRTTIDANFIRSYIADINGNYPIAAGKASRLFAGNKVIYVDELILAALFEYIAVDYLWALRPDDKDNVSFCLRYVLGLLNYSCRLGILTSDNRKVELVKRLAQNCDSNGMNLIADLYWSCLAFAFCHELAHIHLKHTEYDGTKRNVWTEEYEADAVGYDVYLHMIETVREDPGQPFSGVFHDYLYVAPMILFQFYEDAYYLGYWLFGERAGYSHPPLDSRSKALLEISQEDCYTFDTKSGNDLLNCYMDISEFFREQLLLKLQRGKLDQVVQKGVDFMDRPNYEDINLFWDTMRAEIIEEAQRCGWDRDVAIGLWDTAVDVELLSEPAADSFVWSCKGKTYSTKALNVKYSLRKVLTLILEVGGTISFSENAVRNVFIALWILSRLMDISTVELKNVHSTALIKCYQLHADQRAVSEQELLEDPDITADVLTDLNQLGCIEIRDGLVTLVEDILLGDRATWS